MKKLMTLALTGVLAVAAFAVESDPSNTVGFINQVLASGYSTFSACPIGTTVGGAASDYIAGQGTDGDRIFERSGAAWVSYVWSADWTGVPFTYNTCYLYKNNAGAAQNLVVAGDVVAEGTDLGMGDFAAGVFNGFGNPLPLDIDLDADDLTLAEDGFAAGDRIYAMNNGAWVNFTYDGTTYGTDLMAGEAYLVKTAGDVDWDYTVGGGAMAVIPVGVKKVTSVRSAIIR